MQGEIGGTMKTIETLYKEIQEEADKNKVKADHLIKAIKMLEETTMRVIKNMKAIHEELVRPMTQDDIKERDGNSL